MKELFTYLNLTSFLKLTLAVIKTGALRVMRETSTYAVPRAVPVRDKKYENETLAVLGNGFGK